MSTTKQPVETSFLTFDTSKVQFGELLPFGQKGGKISFLSYLDESGVKQPFVVKTPKMWLPFGVSTFENNWDKPKVSLSMNKEVEGVEHFLGEMEKLQEKVCLEAFTNETWKEVLKVTKKLTLEVVSSKMSSIVKYPGNEKYSPTLPVAIKTRDKKFLVNVIDSDRKTLVVTQELLQTMFGKGSESRVVFRPESVWLISGANTFGVTMRMEHMVAYQRQGGLCYSPFQGDNLKETVVMNVEPVVTTTTQVVEQEYDEST